MLALLDGLFRRSNIVNVVFNHIMWWEIIIGYFDKSHLIYLRFTVVTSHAAVSDVQENVIVSVCLHSHITVYGLVLYRHQQLVDVRSRPNSCRDGWFSIDESSVEKELDGGDALSEETSEPSTWTERLADCDDVHLSSWRSSNITGVDAVHDIQWTVR